jgi:phosphoglycolate phosphatase
MTIHAIIFDLDGTLLDSLADIADAANAVLEARGFPTHDVSAYRYFVGDGARRLIHRTVPPRYRDDGPLLEQLLTDFVARYQASWNVQSRLYDGIPEMLDALTQRRLPLAVLSNKPDTATRACVDHFLSAYTFVAVLGQTDHRPPKPDLTGVQEALALLDVPPQACLYLGDTAVDMQTACLAGTFAVGATWGFRDRGELEQGGARKIIDHPRELLPIVDEHPQQTGHPA